MGTGQLLAGNLANLVIALLAFLEVIPWPVAGYLIIGSVIIVTIASLRPRNEASSGETVEHRVATSERPVQRPSMHAEKKTVDRSIEPRELKPKTVVAKAATERTPEEEPEEGRPGEGPNNIGEGDYLSYDVDLEKGEEFVGEVSADDDVNVYVLNEDNLNALDLDQEFWYEEGNEGVRNATVRFTAPDDGVWFFVVENDNNREVSATVKMSVGTPSHPLPSLKTDALDLPDAKLEGKL
jgi:hypothetical protein